MAAYDRKFEIITPSLDRVPRASVEVADAQLLNPLSTSPVALIDGELVTYDATGKLIRASSATVPAFFCIDDRGDYGVQASRKLSFCATPGQGFVANTIVFDPALNSLGAALMGGAVNAASVGSLARWGLIAHTGSNIKLGFVLKLPAINRGLLQFISALA